MYFGRTKKNLLERDLNVQPRRIDSPVLYQLSELAIYCRSPYFVNIFVGGGGLPF